MPRFGLVVRKDLRLDDEFSMGVNFMQETVLQHKVTSLVIKTSPIICETWIVGSHLG